MRKVDAKQILDTGYLKIRGEDWYDFIIGTVVGMGVYGVPMILVFSKLKISPLMTWVYLVALFVAILYRYWITNQAEIVTTNLSGKDNLKLLKEVLANLSWDFQSYESEIDVGSNKRILKFVSFLIVYSDNRIGYNVRYAGIKVRPFFFFGVRTILKHKFEREFASALARVMSKKE